MNKNILYIKKTCLFFIPDILEAVFIFKILFKHALRISNTQGGLGRILQN